MSKITLGTSLSNRFWVNEKFWDDFVAYCKFFQLKLEIIASTDIARKVSIAPGEMAYGIWPESVNLNYDNPDYVYLERLTSWQYGIDNQAIEFVPEEQLARYMLDNDVVIIQTTGIQDGRVFGRAVAFNNQGEMEAVDLHDINRMAQLLTATPDNLDLVENTWQCGSRVQYQ